MTKRYLAFGLIYTVAVIAAGLLWFGIWGKHELTFSQQQIQQRISTKIPMTVPVKLPPIVANHLPAGASRDLTVSNVELQLHDNKIWLHIDADATEFKRPIHASAETEGTLEYRPTKGNPDELAFFFVPITMSVSNVTVGEKPLGDTVRSKLGAMADKLADRYDIELPREELHAEIHAFMQMALEDGARKFLDVVPAYQFKKDWKGTAARMAVSNVEVRDSNVIVTLSYLQLTMFVIFSALVFVAAIIGAGVLFVFLPLALAASGL